ncbi:MAG: hypothetical protein CTY12_03365 [Methylotenera sp.]|nr:MAG: hypothetical protein CTY12_03365 [Methylotenera sp.]
MDIKTQVLEQLNSLYNFAIDKETFDRVTFLGIGKKIQKIRFDKHAKDQATKDNQLIETFLSEYTNESHKRIAKVLLENQLRQLSIQQPNTGVTDMKPLLMGTSARLIKKLMIFDNIIGLQPMTGPVGQIFHMQYTYTDVESETKGETTKHMALEIVSGAVEAYSRELQAAYTIEAAQDMLCYHGLNIAEELASALSDEIMTEIVYEIVSDLMALANRNPFTKELADRVPNTDGLRPDDYYKVARIKLNMASSEIARKTRRGPGNVIITSMMGVTILKQIISHTGNKFVSTPTEEGRSYQIGTISHVGSVVASDDRVVYSVYATTSPVVDRNDKVTFLIGYKGTSATDTGYIYSPYVPLRSTGIIVDPITFQPLVRLMTRYGKWVKLLKKETELEIIEPNDIVHSSDYYVAIEIDTSNMVSITEK